MADTYTQDKEQLDIVYRGRKGVTVTKQGIVNRHKSAGAAKDIDALLPLIADALDDHQRRLGVASNRQIEVREQSAREFVESPDAGMDVVLFKVISRKIENTDPEGERRPWNPQLREQVDHPDDGTKTLEVYGLSMENIVEFRVYSRHNKRANDLAIFFQNFILSYIWYFREHGIKNLMFDSRTADEIDTIGGQEFSVRPIRFKILTECIYQEEAKKLSKIIVEYDTGRALNITTTNEELDIQEVNILR